MYAVNAQPPFEFVRTIRHIFPMYADFFYELLFHAQTYYVSFLVKFLPTEKRANRRCTTMCIKFNLNYISGILVIFLILF